MMARHHRKMHNYIIYHRGLKRGPSIIGLLYLGAVGIGDVSPRVPSTTEEKLLEGSGGLNINTMIAI